MSPILGEPGRRVLLLGNEAVARGALEAGVALAAAYPGTPSTEIMETLLSVAPRVGIYAEWSVNEKVALELAVGASMCGARAMAVMKHVGLNVAADTFMSLGYAGVEGGLVVVVADDPGAHSSQNEQDTRLYGVHAYIPVLEPWSPAEAKELTRVAFDLSERYKTAFVVRMTTRVSHTRGEVVLGPLREPVRGGCFKRKPERWVLLPVNVRKLHPEALSRIATLAEELDGLPFNELIEGEGEWAIISCGVAYGYVKEALRLLKARPHVLKLSSTYPVPKKLVRRLFELAPQGILVVEELEPVVEMQVVELAREEGYEGLIVGKKLIPRVQELNVNIVGRAIAEVLGLKWSIEEVFKPPQWLPPRPPTFCPGCGHRAAYYALKVAVRSAKARAVYPGDIGCYTLGFFPPFKAVDTSFCMGSGLGIGLGVSQISKEEVVIATMGDSTFYHAGIPALLNAVYNKHSVVLVVMDNLYTAMTGHQPHPGTGAGPWGEERPKVPIENVARALGVEFVEVVDPYDIERMVSVVRRAIEWARRRQGPAVVIARRKCALIEYRERLRRGEKITPYVVDETACKACGVCTSLFACPALARREDGKAYVISELCVGCGVCAQICPVGAIRREEVKKRC